MAPALVWADADLGAYRDAAGVRLYPDHELSDVWYLTPPAPRLAIGVDGEPGYALDFLRYSGRGGTGDESVFWARAVLELELTRERPVGRMAAIREELASEGIPEPVFRTMPVSGASLRLLFGDLEKSWTEGARWRDGFLALTLDEDLAQVLWQSVEAGQTLVSLELTERLAGVRRENEAWVEGETAALWSVGIEMDPVLHPDRLRRTDLDARMTRGYTELEVFCFDFLENLEPDLYVKEVEVAIETAGRDLVESARFDATSDYRAHLEFPLSKDLEAPYRVREIRTYFDGRRDYGPWRSRQGEFLLDITAYREPESESSEPETGGPP